MLNDKLNKILYIILIGVLLYIGMLLLPYLLVVLRFIIRIIIPFIIAFAIAFILQPMVRFFQNRKISRGLSVIIVLAIFVAAIFILAQATIPHFVKDVKLLISDLPKITSELEELLNNFAKKFDYLPVEYRPNFDNISSFFSKHIIKIGNFPTTFFNKFLSYISIIILVPMILIYFLLDYEKILCKFRNYLTTHNKIRFKNYLADLNKIMGSYFRGVFIVMIIVSVAFTIAFWSIGLEFALFFGIIIGVTNIIPYVGAYIGGSLPVLFALLDSPKKAIIVVIISIILQTLESDVLTPFVQSRHIKIHPLIVLLSLIVFGALFGIIGMMISLPILSILKITFEHYPINIFKKPVI